MNSEKKTVLPATPEYKLGHTTFEEIRQTVDMQTGEVTETYRGVSRTQDNEPDFVKIYYNTMLAFQGIDNISADLLVSLCKHIEGYNNSGTEPLVFTNNRYNKEKMAKELGIGPSMMKKNIEKLIKSGILVKSNMKTIYYVNPLVIARGKWKNIKDLQMHFSLQGGNWQVDTILDPVSNTNEEDEDA